MNTSSVIIKKIHAFLAWLNYYFEYSLIFRGLTAVGNSAKTSRIITSFASGEHRDYWRGSLIMRGIGAVARAVVFAVVWVFQALARANETSLNRQIFLYCKTAISQDNGFCGFWKKAFAGCAPVRLVRWFFGTCDCVLKASYMIFLMGALMVPSPMWSNTLLLISAAVFAALFSLKWLISPAPSQTNSSFLSNFFPKKFAGAWGWNPQGLSLSPALILFVFFCALSIFTGYGGMDSVRVFTIFFACVVHSVIVSAVFKSKDDFRLFFTIMVVALAATALFGFYQLFMGIEIRAEHVDLDASPGLMRLYSTMGNQNNDAQVWAMLLPFLLAVAITVKCDVKRLLIAGAVLLVVAAFALTYSRAGYVALAAGLGVFVLMVAPRLVPVALIALILAVPFIPAGILERLLTLGQDTSSQYRFQIWQGVLYMLEDFWIRGIGMGPAAFVRIYQSYAHPAALRALHSHNQFLDIILHSGIGALVAFLAYLFRQYKHGVSSFLAETDREMKIYMAAGIAALTVFVVLGVGEYVWFHPRVMLVFWVVAGLTAYRRA